VEHIHPVRKDRSPWAVVVRSQTWVVVARIPTLVEVARSQTLVEAERTGYDGGEG
jgi:hypothetical protein